MRDEYVLKFRQLGYQKTDVNVGLRNEHLQFRRLVVSKQGTFYSFFFCFFEKMIKVRADFSIVTVCETSFTFSIFFWRVLMQMKSRKTKIPSSPVS